MRTQYKLLFGAAIATSCFGQLTVAGDWEVRVAMPGMEPQTVSVAPPSLKAVSAERYERIPEFDPKASGWRKGTRLEALKTMETSAANLLDPASLTLSTGPGAPLLTRGIDYEIDPVWATFGRLATGSIKPDTPVFASYRYATLRIDSVIQTADNKVVVRAGEARVATPPLPELKEGERRLGNIYLPGSIARLSPELLFPVLEQAYPERPPADNATVTRVIRRLKSGKTVRILAWGDSVTDGTFLPEKSERWQEQFAARLRQEYPEAKIELLTQAWGGRNTGTYLAEPPGSPHNYKETVLELKPDLIISEFVNDAGLKPAQVEERYSKLLADFRAIGAEWIILTPHYVRPDWMGLAREREIDDDPRPYVQAVRQFAAGHDVGLADASLRWGRLWRQGIPYTTLLVNSINHPNVAGMRLFADALMELFR